MSSLTLSQLLCLSLVCSMCDVRGDLFTFPFSAIDKLCPVIMVLHGYLLTIFIEFFIPHRQCFVTADRSEGWF